MKERKYSLGELLGASDVAEILGWDIRKVSAYARIGKAGFPQPIGTIGKRPIWRRGDIERYRDGKLTKTTKEEETS